MKTFLYKIDCVTNLHVGSGDVNYNVVDNEVEKDSVLDCPVIHSSGVKGALRDAYPDKEEARRIFGSPASADNSFSGGAVKFMDAFLLSRPLRVRSEKSALSCIQATTPEYLNHLIRQMNMLSCRPDGLPETAELDPDAVGALFGNAAFLTTESGIRVEDEDTAVLPADFPGLDPLKKILGPRFALARSLDDYPLPVIARNCLEDGRSVNLWYEEYVPHGSVFYLFALAPDRKDVAWMDGQLVQFGGNASIGYGFTRISRWGEEA